MRSDHAARPNRPGDDRERRRGGVEGSEGVPIAFREGTVEGSLVRRDARVRRWRRAGHRRGLAGGARVELGVGGVEGVGIEHDEGRPEPGRVDIDEIERLDLHRPAAGDRCGEAHAEEREPFAARREQVAVPRARGFVEEHALVGEERVARDLHPHEAPPVVHAMRRMVGRADAMPVVRVPATFEPAHRPRCRVGEALLGGLYIARPRRARRTAPTPRPLARARRSPSARSGRRRRGRGASTAGAPTRHRPRARVRAASRGRGLRAPRAPARPRTAR